MGPSKVLKYKYSQPNREPASKLEDKHKLERIQIELKDPVIFASGMDSTFLMVRLFNPNNEIITTIDPSELTLFSSEDMKAKPFVLKQGVYKAEILPKVKSKNIHLRVDWLERIFSDQVILKTTRSPMKQELAPLVHDFFQSKSIGEVNAIRGSLTPETGTDGFLFQNLGDNIIVKSEKFPHPMRSFTFNYPEQAGQNLMLEVDDFLNSNSQTKHSIFMFFPRKYIPIVEQLSGTLNVTLPNGEKMIFSKNSKEITDGVFLEGPVDTSSNLNAGHFPNLRYQGKGVILRANAIGHSPQLEEFEKDKIDLEFGLNGSADVLLINGLTGSRCRRPKSDFWDKIDVSPIVFKFSSDKKLDAYLKKHCGFGIPGILEKN